MRDDKAVRHDGESKNQIASFGELKGEYSVLEHSFCILFVLATGQLCSAGILSATRRDTK